MRRFCIVGLTGPTGAGKSTVSRFFEEAGFAVINADALAREIMEPGSACLMQLKAAFGSDIINENGEPDRRLIAERAFSSRENTQLLNDITHPAIFLRALKLCREYIDSGRTKILFDAPVLFESNSDIMCDAAVTVTAPKEVRIERLTKRDGRTRAEIERRISAQHDDNFYIARSDYAIDGSAPLQSVKARTEKIISAIMREKTERIMNKE